MDHELQKFIIVNGDNESPTSLNVNLQFTPVL